MITNSIFRQLFWVFAVVPITGVSFLASEVMYLSYQEIFLLLIMILCAVSVSSIKPVEVIIIIVLMMFTLINVINVASSLSAFQLLKDLKPYFFFLGTLLCVYTRREAILDGLNLNKVLAIIVSADILCYLLLIIFPDLMPEGIRKGLFLRSGVYRYGDIAVIFAQTLVIAAFCHYRMEPRKLSQSFLLFVAIVALTQDRAFLLLGFGAFAINLLPRLSFFNMVLGLSVLIVSLIFLSGFEQNEITNRFSNLGRIETILEELTVRILLPVLEGGYLLTMQTLLFGEGLAFRFFIPWFDWRGINTYHNSVDSFFVTFFVKHGLVGLSLYLFALLYCLRGQPKLVFVWLIIYSVTHNGVYQANFLLMLFFLVLMGRQKIA